MMWLSRRLTSDRYINQEELQIVYAIHNSKETLPRFIKLPSVRRSPF